MSILSKFFNWLFQSSYEQERKAMESYLSQAQSASHLEELQRRWDARKDTRFF